MASKHFQDLLKRMDEIHIKKNADYANDENPFQNFERAAILVSWFKDPIDQVFAGIIGIKLARLAELESSNKTPNNESLDDTYLDGTNYFGLWAAYKLYIRDTRYCDRCSFKTNDISLYWKHREAMHCIKEHET